MDTDVLQAQLQEARAEEAQGRNAVETALAQVRQRQSERAASQAIVAPRQAEQVVAQTTVDRTRDLAQQRAASIQDYENDVAQEHRTPLALSSAAQTSSVSLHPRLS